MKFEEVLPALREGKYIKLEGTDSTLRFYMDGDKLMELWRDGYKRTVDLVKPSMLINNDWEVVE